MLARTMNRYPSPGPRDARGAVRAAMLLAVMTGGILATGVHAQGGAAAREALVAQWLDAAPAPGTAGARLVPMPVADAARPDAGVTLPSAGAGGGPAIKAGKKPAPDRASAKRATVAVRSPDGAVVETGLAEILSADLGTRVRAVIAGAGEGAAAAVAGPRPAKVKYASGRSEDLAVVAPTATVDHGRARAKIAAGIADPAGLEIYHGDMGTPSHIEAADLSDTAQRSPLLRDMARGFLNRNRDVLRLQDPDREMAVKAETTDALGFTRVRFRQEYQGVPVYGQEASVYIDGAGRLARMSGRYRPTPEIASVAPALTLAQAQETAVRQAGAALDFRAGELVILPGDTSNAMTLAWHLEGYAGAMRGWHFFVDAADGALLKRYSAIDDADGKVQASGRNLGGDTVIFNAWQQAGTNYMIDVTRPGGGSSAPNSQVGNIQAFKFCATVPCASYARVTSASLSSGWDAAAVSALDSVYKVLDYYAGTFNRNGIDGNGGTVKLVVNALDEDTGKGLDNAFWTSAQQMMFFGAGDTGFTNLARSLDVTAHEMTHGVVSNSAGFVKEGHSGALNESFADFFGAMVDRANWQIGEGIMRNGPYLRNIADPHLPGPDCAAAYAQPRHMDEFIYPSEEHCNDGIPNRAAYLIAEGLTAEGLGTSVGRAHAEQIYYYALTQLMHPSDQFVDARRQLIKAAQLKYGATSPEAVAVARAFDLVGVAEPQTTAPATALVPTDGDPINATSKVIYRRAADGGLMVEGASGVTGPVNANPASDQRPAVYWRASDGKGVLFYINQQTRSLRAVTLGTGKDELVATGDFYAFAVSPDGSYAAYTTNNERFLFILDLANGQTYQYTVLMPSADGAPRDVGLDAYSPAFDYLSENIIFDFAIPHAELNGPASLQFSFGTLNLLSGYFDTLATGQPANLQLVNPVYATNNNYVIAFDLVDSANMANSGVYVRNTTTRSTAGLTGLDLTGQKRLALGHPVFNREDSALIIQTRSTLNGADCDPCRIYGTAITKGADGTWTLSTQLQGLTSFAGGFPVLLIEGARSSVLNPAMSLSATALQFASTAIGGSAQKTLTLTNTGNVDISILGFTVVGADFRTTAADRLLPRRQSIVVPVSFVPLVPGARTGTLTIRTDWGNRTVSLTGTATGTPSTVSRVVEYYHSVLDNYFITADPNEQAAVDSGAAGAEWRRTGVSFKPGGPNQVCRFYGNGKTNPATGTRYGPNSHFYTADPAECNALKAAYNPNAKSWFFESNDFNITPAGAGGTCPAGLVPVYRAYNNGFARGIDSNHRITTSLAAIADVVNRGWRSEGVVMCAPS